MVLGDAVSASVPLPVLSVPPAKASGVEPFMVRVPPEPEFVTRPSSIVNELRPQGRPG